MPDFEHEPFFTVCVSVFNAADRIGDVLKAIEAQEKVGKGEWEVVIIDNNSTDESAKIVEEWIRKSTLVARFVRECRQGLSHVRHRAYLEARGQILAYLDDDNFPDPSWVRNGIDFFAAHPRAGIAGGRILPRLSGDPPAYWNDIKWMLAICEIEADQPVRRDVPGSQIDLLPVGAGMAIRREVLGTIYSHFRMVLSGRRGNRLTSGEDMEIGMRVLELGWESWFVPSMIAEHTIPPRRLEDRYLSDLRRNIMRANVILDTIRIQRKYPPTAVYAAKVLYWAWCAVTFRNLLFPGKDFHTLQKKAVMVGRLQGATDQLLDAVAAAGLMFSRRRTRTKELLTTEITENTE